jgi:TonB family protein
MTTLESIILSYLANALWQLPLLFAAGWIAARVLRPLGPLAEHRVWVSVLLFQAFLPAASSIPSQTLLDFSDFFGGPHNGDQTHVSVVMGPGATLVNPHFPAWLLASLAIVYTAVTAWFAIRFLWRLYATHLLGRNAAAVTLAADVAAHWEHCARTFGVKTASLGTSTQIYGPITIGIVRKLVLLPQDMFAALPETELHTAIAHEFAHMRRHDFFKNLLYEMLSLPVHFHPVLALTRDRLTETREMVCDQLAASFADQHQYGRSLLKLATVLVEGSPARSPHAIGIFDANTFERRVMRLTEKPIQISTRRRFMTLAACTVLGAGICATTLALSVHVDALAAVDEQGPTKATGRIAVSPEVMQKQIVRKVPPIYPEEAKKARIQGKVELSAVIAKTGEVENLRVVSGPKELQQSALDAVRQWLYKPYLLNGQPVEIRTTINVIYTLRKPENSGSESK